ncbi:hypothetical protein [Bradyrhizobium sp.]|uniref:hypothetical protein n=1 Tax=Bradyrhizobium sp. TaxID=376 RepID=UPI0025C52846|nr:hypothetical protein [Bradyrhizobium sp.]
MPRKSKPSASGWDRTFDDPIPLPDGRKLRTLPDAGNYIAKLPKAEHDAEEWEKAIRALMLVAEHGGDSMLPRIGIMRGAASSPRARTDGAQEAGRNIGSFGDGLTILRALLTSLFARHYISSAPLR